MLPTFHIRKPFHRRTRRHGVAADVPPIPPDPPVPVSAQVTRLSIRHFQWYFDLTYDSAGHASWTAADFASLAVEGRLPLSIVEADGEAGTLTLEYEFSPGPSPGSLEWTITEAPAVLVFADGLGALIVPQSGVVNE